MLIPSDAQTLDDFLDRGPYVSYSYSYPHKTAYRQLSRPLSLGRIWENERVDSLFLYLHIPFCEMRCGFCNLFTYSQPATQMAEHYLDALERQAQVVRLQVPNASFSRVAIGGGTPSYLSVNQLERLFGMLRDVHGVDGSRIPISFEVSPTTVDEEKLACLRSFGVDRISVGVQSFERADAKAMGRPQNNGSVERSLDLIASHQFPTLNLDLIYGGQTLSVESWMLSVEQALSYKPEEVYLYPLYVRPLTGLSRVGTAEHDVRLQCYRIARDELMRRQFEQISMRNFRRCSTGHVVGPPYRCQEDGMIGLGCGARSYTQSLHYAHRFAVKQAAVLSRIREFIDLDNAEMSIVGHGIELDADERRRRFFIVSLLLASGVDREQYESCFGRDVAADFREVAQLEERGLVQVDARRIRLTASGLENADAIGPWLYSANVRRRMEAFQWSLA